MTQNIQKRCQSALQTWTKWNGVCILNSKWNLNNHCKTWRYHGNRANWPTFTRGWPSCEILRWWWVVMIDDKYGNSSPEHCEHCEPKRSQAIRTYFKLDPETSLSISLPKSYWRIQSSKIYAHMYHLTARTLAGRQAMRSHNITHPLSHSAQWGGGGPMERGRG